MFDVSFCICWRMKEPLFRIKATFNENGVLGQLFIHFSLLYDKNKL